MNRKPTASSRIVAGRAHRDRDAAVDAPAVLATQADLQRLLDGQQVRLLDPAGR